MMRRCLLAIGLAVAAAGCGSDNPAVPSGPPNTVVFTAQLLPSNEVPPISNAESTGSGNVTITFNLTRDAGGNITAGTADFNATFSGFPPGTALTLGHIHTGAVGANGGFVVNLSVQPGDATFTNGSGTLVKNGITITPVDVANQIINNPAGYYFNVHTGLNPGGVARGQLVMK